MTSPKYFSKKERELYGLPPGGRPVENKKGLRYGRLVCLEFIPPQGLAKSKWKCQCDCGVIKLVGAKVLTDGGANSCGCLRREVSRRPRIDPEGDVTLRAAACLWHVGVWADQKFFSYLKRELKINHRDLERARRAQPNRTLKEQKNYAKSV